MGILWTSRVHPISSTYVCHGRPVGSPSEPHALEVPTGYLSDSDPEGTRWVAQAHPVRSPHVSHGRLMGSQ